MDLPILSCPSCGTSLVDIKSATTGAGLPTPNDIFLCGSCACLSHFTLEGMTEMSAETYATLDPEERRDLRYAARNIIAQSRKNLRRVWRAQKFLLEDRNENKKENGSH